MKSTEANYLKSLSSHFTCQRNHLCHPHGLPFPKRRLVRTLTHCGACLFCVAVKKDLVNFVYFVTDCVVDCLHRTEKPRRFFRLSGGDRQRRKCSQHDSYEYFIS